MSSDPIRGRTIRFTFSDGPMARKTFEHVFDAKGTVSFRLVGDGASSSGASAKVAGGERSHEPKYAVVMMREDVGAVAYVGGSGYTLTTVLHFKTKKLAAFSSNEMEVSVQHGTFEYADVAPAQAATHR